MHLVSSLSGGCLPERRSSFALGVWAGWECLVPILDDSLQVVFHFLRLFINKRCPADSFIVRFFDDL